jgi:hypothetical protein
LTWLQFLAPPYRAKAISLYNIPPKNIRLGRKAMGENASGAMTRGLHPAAVSFIFGASTIGTVNEERPGADQHPQEPHNFLD